MVDIYFEAMEAIEEWAKERRPEVARYKWIDKKPDADWKYNANSWTGEMGNIQGRFEAKIGYAISFPPSEKRATVSFVMAQIYYVLARKAEVVRADGPTALQQLKS